MNSIEGGIVVANGAESSLVSEVKEKQDQDPILLDLKANVHKHIVLDFEEGGEGVMKYHCRLCVQGWMKSKKKSWRKIIAQDTPSIRVPPRCTIT